jgi:hypothetical protein
MLISRGQRSAHVKQDEQSQIVFELRVYNHFLNYQEAYKQF